MSLDITRDDCEKRKLIGNGSFTSVYLCKLKTSLPEHKDQLFALKECPLKEGVKHHLIHGEENEIKLLSAIHHPFIIKLLWHDSNLNMLFPYMSGGDLYSLLFQRGHITKEETLFYASEIILGVAHLHSLSIIYRDLKPENILIDCEGHIKLCDFNFAKKTVQDKTWSICGTPEYLAPEIILNKGHGRAVDWWSFGIVIFEMLVGYTPFCSDSPISIYHNIIANDVKYPMLVDPVTKDLISSLLKTKPEERLGFGIDGAENLKKHRLFRPINWEAVLKKQIAPPYVPPLEGARHDLGSNQKATLKPDDSLFQEF